MLLGDKTSTTGGGGGGTMGERACGGIGDTLGANSSSIPKKKKMTPKKKKT